MASPVESQYSPTSQSIQPPPAEGGSLPATGFEAPALIAAAIFVILLGFALRLMRWTSEDDE